MGFVMKYFFQAVPMLASLALAQIPSTEVVSLPTASAWGGSDVLGSQLIGSTYNASKGPGIWIVADGGYRLYLNGELLAHDNQAGRVQFIPITFLPGDNALSVIGIDGNGAPGVLVQIDELEKSHVSNATWKASASVSDNSWKFSSYNDQSWANAQASGTAASSPSGQSITGFAPNSAAKWIWTSNSTQNQAVLRYRFKIQAEGFGASTTGGTGGKIVQVTTLADLKKELQSSEAVTILIPEGTYDFRTMRVEQKNTGRYNWCTRACKSTDFNSSNTYFRVTFDGTCGAGESIAESVELWDTWVTTRANKSLIGMGRGAHLRGLALSMRGNENATNNIFRNLTLYDVNPHLIEAGDGLSSDNTSKLWVDHISYKWISDGMDLGGSSGTREATVSWLEYDGSNDKNCNGNDPYVALVENADLTYANSYWRNTSGRVPKVYSKTSASRVHIYNNYIDSNTFFIVGANGASSTYKSEVLFENNSINNATGYPTLKEPNGYISSIDNQWSGKTGTHQIVSSSGVRTPSTEPKDAVFTPPYSYAKRTVANLASENVLHTGVGGRWGKMPAYNQSAGISNKAPSVTLTAPLNGATPGNAPASISLSANATDSDGNIAKVDFYMGNTLVGSATSAPYSVQAQNISEGTHSIIAIATDNNGLSSRSLYHTITVAAAAPTAPTITSSNAAAVVENTLFVIKVTATNPQGGTLTYEINGGDDQALFILSSVTGNMYFRKAPNFEAPTDADANNNYKVRVKVSNAAGISTTQNVVIQVLDASEAPSNLRLSNTGFNAAAPQGSTIGQLNADDPDANTTLVYSLLNTGTDFPAFAIVGNELRTAQVFSNTQQTQYQIEIRASDAQGLSTSQSFTLHMALPVSSSSSIRLSSSSAVIASSSSSTAPSVSSSSQAAAVSSSSDTPTSSSSLVASSSTEAPLFSLQPNHRHLLATRFKVYDIQGKQRMESAQIPMQLPSGRWIIRAYNQNGQEVSNWVVNKQ